MLYINSQEKMNQNMYIKVMLALAFFSVPAISLPVVLDSSIPEAESQDYITTKEAQSSLPEEITNKKKPTIPPSADEKSEKTKDSIICTIESPNATGTYIESMTLGYLNNIINIIAPVVNDTQPSHKKYLTVDYGNTIFHSYKPYLAYRRLFDAVETNDIPKPSNIWMSHSPCLSCSRRLIYEYGKRESIKPTIRIANIDLGDSLYDEVNLLKCMAKMVHLNITITTWDWTHVKNNMQETSCIDSIDLALQDSSFNERRTTIKKIIEFINELSSNPQVESWCQVFS